MVYAYTLSLRARVIGNSITWVWYPYLHPSIALMEYVVVHGMLCMLSTLPAVLHCSVRMHTLYSWASIPSHVVCGCWLLRYTMSCIPRWYTTWYPFSGCMHHESWCNYAPSYTMWYYGGCITPLHTMHHYIPLVCRVLVYAMRATIVQWYLAYAVA